MEKYDEAMQIFQKALDIDPGNQEAREAIALYKEGKMS
jgi:tetratricopeptide (TPR) repeat protein